ncbi:MAG TPA: peptidoglycan editing factor PgeF [Bacteroidales bacterium]|nr:peptidoglycan editing factor PgeF [Bacteroidales bacterium]HRS18481.1 peptidoglycan editing factor PgeF [Bacteroidales bacterium]
MMKFQTIQSIPYFQYIDSPLCIAGVSTRNGGISKGVYSSMNLGTHTADNPTHVQHNRQLFFGTIAPGFTVAYMRQTHSNIVLNVDSDFVNDTEGDAFYTTKKGVLLTVSLADCGSVIIHDDSYSLIAAIHCGWRGVHSQIIEKTISELSAYVKPEKLTAYIGPTIQQQYYEVGKEFLDLFPHSYFKENGEKLYFNLNGRIEDVLLESGVGMIMNSRMGTFAVPEHFYSYRRDGATGRFCAFIGIV